MKKLISAVLLFLVIFIIFFFFHPKTILINKVKEKPLLRYTFENLKKTEFLPSQITLGKIMSEGDAYVSRMFYYKIRDVINGENKEKRVSGLINIPKKEGHYPILILIRGFVPIEIYSSGMGTKRDGEYFAENGYIALAPDFLGYGQSDNSQGNSIEERFQTYTAALTLISSLNNLNLALDPDYSNKIRADASRIGIWGHSNGGHIALSVLEIAGKNYPTVLWAPVSKPFPYSILYFADESDDHGKALREVVAKFEEDYDIEQYSTSNFYSWINAPIQVHQGTVDDAVPLEWSNDLVADLAKLNKEVSYFTYPGADHNLTPGWEEAITRSLEFYRNNL